MLQILTFVALVAGNVHSKSSSGSFLRALQQADLDNPSGTIPSFTLAIPMVLALDYLDNTTATRLESANPQDSLVRSFCSSVQEQVGSNQVKLAAVEAGVTIATSNTTSNDCKLLDSVRTYDSNAPNNELFTLEIELTQAIYAATDNITLLIPIVETGFNRGRGGRVRFRSLLQQAQASFSSITDIRVLRELSKPQMPPTVSPSLFPSISRAPSTSVPSLSPSSFPTTLPSSLSPTTGLSTQIPTSTSPSSLPSKVSLPSPSSFPSSYIDPSVVPSTTFPSDIVHIGTDPPLLPETREPTRDSLKRTSAPDVAPDEKSDVTRPPSFARVGTARPVEESETLVPSEQPTPPTSLPSIQDTQSVRRNQIISLAIGAIIGGILALLVMCYCCVYCHFGKRKTAEATDEELGYGDGNRRNKSQRNQAPSDGVSSLPIVPGIVQLDEDNMSLANTTLGGHTVGRRPPMKKRFAADSFDESSLYTSTGFNALLPDREISEDSGMSNPINLASLNLEKIATESRSSAPNDERDPVRIGVSIEYEDALFFEEHEEEALLGAKGLHSPLAKRIEEMVNDQLGPQSDASSSSSLGLPMSPGAESPTAMLGQEASVFIARDDSSSEASPIEPSDDANSTTSSGTHSSITDKIGNVVAPYSIDSEVHAPESTSESKMLVGSVTTQYTTPDAPGKYSFFATEQTDSADRAKISPSTYRTRYTSAPSLLELHHFVPVIPADSTRSDEDTGPTETFQSGSTPGTRASNTSGAGDSTSLTEASCKTPRKLTLAFDAVATDSKDQPADSTPKSFATASSKAGPSPPSTSTFRPSSTATIRVASNVMADLANSEPKMPELGEPPRPNPADSPRSESSKNAVIESPLSTKSVVTSHTCSPVSLKTVDPLNKGTERTVASPHGTIEPDEWLLSTIERALGPRSASADLESLAGRSLDGSTANKARSYKKRRNSMGASTVTSFSAVEEKSAGTESFMTPHRLKHDLHRLEVQLAMLKTEVNRTKNATAASVGSPTKARMGRKQRVVVVAPPGKLGVILANRKDGSGTVISDIRPSSTLCGLLIPGDKLVAVNGQDVTGMVVAEITQIMKEHANQERRLTVITSSKNRDETKSNSP